MVTVEVITSGSNEMPFNDEMYLQVSGLESGSRVHGAGYPSAQASTADQSLEKNPPSSALQTLNFRSWMLGQQRPIPSMLRVNHGGAGCYS